MLTYDICLHKQHSHTNIICFDPVVLYVTKLKTLKFLGIDGFTVNYRIEFDFFSIKTLLFYIAFSQKH